MPVPRPTPVRAVLAVGSVVLCAAGVLGTVLVDRVVLAERPGGVPAEADASSQPLRLPPQVSDPGGYTFLSAGVDGQPVRWDPCRPVHLVVRPDHGPPGGRAAVLAALDEVGAATGLVFVVEGETDEGPSSQRDWSDPDRYGARWSPVLLAWSDAAEHPPLAGAIGVAGPVDGASDPDGRSTWVSGMVVLDAAWFADNLAQATGSRRAAAVLRHELAHLAGLGHSQDPFSLMSPAYQSVFQLSLADRAGLARLGAGPCGDHPGTT